MELVDDSNSYWWACRLISTGEVGYIPAENIETPSERLARLNRSRNTEKIILPNKPTRSKDTGRKIKFADSITIIQADGIIRDEADVQKAVTIVIGIKRDTKEDINIPTNLQINQKGQL